MTQYVYYFGDGVADGDATMKSLLGGKGANLAEMVRQRQFRPEALHQTFLEKLAFDHWESGIVQHFENLLSPNVERVNSPPKFPWLAEI